MKSVRHGTRLSPFPLPAGAGKGEGESLKISRRRIFEGCLIEGFLNTGVLSGCHASPSPRPSPAGRGRTVGRLSREPATGFAGRSSERSQNAPLPFPLPAGEGKGEGEALKISRRRIFEGCLIEGFLNTGVLSDCHASPSPRPSPAGRGGTAPRSVGSDS